MNEVQQRIWEQTERDGLEHGVNFDENGNVILERVGTKDTLKTSPSDWGKVNDTVGVHTHPRALLGEIDIPGFSDSDISYAVAHNLRETRVISGNTVSILSRGDKSRWGFGNINQYGMVVDEVHNAKYYIYKAQEAVREDLAQKVKKGLITQVDANNSYWSNVSRYFAEQHGFNYKEVPLR